jgi:N-acetylmuramoyl-L-alanine amidase
MQIQDYKVRDIPFKAAESIGGVITPEVVVLHDTAGNLNKGNSAQYLRTAPNGVSVHFVVERDGTIEQQVPVNRRAGHAGRSSYHGTHNVNGFSIGIEIVNPGKMTSSDGRVAKPWFGTAYDVAEFNIQRVSTKEHGDGWWMPYTEAQIEAVRALLRVLFDGVPSLKDIVAHWYISPGRKTDTNPLFPLDQIKSLTLGRDDPHADSADAKSATVEAGAEDMAMIDVPGGSLNMRRWPSFNPNIIAEIPDRTVVPVLRSGIFDGRAWIKVLFDGQEGWIVKSYTKDVGVNV